MLGSIARFASGRRTKWVIVGFWLLLAIVMQLPGKLTDVTEDRISSFLPDDSPAIVADKFIEERFPGGQTTSSVAVYHRDGGLTRRRQADDRAPRPRHGRGRRRAAGAGRPAFSARARPRASCRRTARRRSRSSRSTRRPSRTINDAHRGGARGRQRRRWAQGRGHRPRGAGDRPAARASSRPTSRCSRSRPARADPAAGDLPLAAARAHPAPGGRDLVHGRQRLHQDLRRRRPAGHEHLDVAARRPDVRRGHGLLPVAGGQIHGGTASRTRTATRRCSSAIPRAAPAIIASAGTVILAMLVLIFAELASSRTVGPVNAIGILHRDGGQHHAAAGVPGHRRPARVLAEQARRLRPQLRARGGARGRRLALGAGRSRGDAPAGVHDRRRLPRCS